MFIYAVCICTLSVLELLQLQFWKTWSTHSLLNLKSFSLLVVHIWLWLTSQMVKYTRHVLLCSLQSRVLCVYMCLYVLVTPSLHHHHCHYKILSALSLPFSLMGLWGLEPTPHNYVVLFKMWYLISTPSKSMRNSLYPVCS